MKAAVIGGGAAGLCAARRCLDASLGVTLFEASHSVGGTWVYTPEINTHSSMYEGLRTNLPKEIMRFSDLEFPAHLPSFVACGDVLEYLKQYSEPVKQFIKFGCEVRAVRRDGGKWEVSYCQDNQPHSQHFDVVFVCNGHYAKPFVPPTQGSFAGPILHSHNYRSPRQYQHKTVAVVGAGPSGIDIALQLADVARKVYLLSDKEPWSCELPTSVVQCAAVLRCDGHQLHLADGSSISADCMIFCTGYLYELGFLGEEVEVRHGGKMVSPTYLHVAHAHHPSSLFFIGLNTTVLPFTLFECQMTLSLALISGNAKVTPQQIDRWESQRLRDLEARGVDGSMFHVLGTTQWDYFNEVCEAAACPLSLPPVLRMVYEDTVKRRRADVVNYKLTNYSVTCDSFTVSESSHQRILGSEGESVDDNTEKYSNGDM